MLRDLSILAQNTSRDETSGHQSLVSPLNPAASFPTQGTPSPDKCTGIFHQTDPGTRWFLTGNPRVVVLLPGATV